MENMKKWVDIGLEWVSENPVQATGIAASTLLVIVYYQKRRLSPNLPPGPRGWPVVGSLFSLSEKWHKDILRMREQYGDVYCIYFGSQPVIVLASYDAVKEALITQANDFSERAKIPTVGTLDELMNSPYDGEDKKFDKQAFRDFGGIKANTDQRMVDEMSVMIDILRQQHQTPTDISEIALLTATNIISNILFSERFEHNDPKLVHLCDLTKQWYADFNGFYGLAMLMPTWYISLFAKSAHQALMKSTTNLQEYVQAQIDQHRQTLDPNDLRDFVDVYLAKKNPTKKSLAVSLLTFLPDASDTVSVFMRWIVLYVTLYPDVQKKAQEEIDKVLGSNTMVSLSDRPLLKYTQAVLVEVMRICDGSLAGGFRETTYNTTFRGYDVPKSTWIFPCLYAVNKDPNLFPDPEKFAPERFIDESGALCNTHLVIALGMGPRMCLGENLVKTELFLFLANLLKAFSLSFPSDEPTPSTEPVIQHPKPFKTIFTER